MVWVVMGMTAPSSIVAVGREPYGTHRYVKLYVALYVALYVTLYILLMKTN